MSTAIPPHTKVLGPDLLAFVLNVSREEAIEITSGGMTLTETQRSIVTFLEQELINARTMYPNSGQDIHLLVGPGCNWSQAGHSIFTQARLMTGVGLPPVDSDASALEAALSKLCFEYFPFMVIPHNWGHPSGSFLVPFPFRVRGHADFVQALKADAALEKLFPASGGLNVSGQDVYLYSSSGSGGLFSLTLLHAYILQAAAMLMHARGKCALADLLAAALEVLDNFRTAVDGGPAHAYVVEIFDLVELPDSARIPAQGGILSAIPQTFLQYISPEVRPGKRGKQADCRCMLIRREPFSFTWKVPQPGVHAPLEPSWPAEMSNCKVSLATGLSLADDAATAARKRATIMIDPINIVTGGIWSPAPPSLAKPHLATEVECARLSKFFEQIGASDLSTLQIAITRYLNALLNRQDVQDSLLDAVIGLESLFGNSSEITFSVACGVALLLGKDEEDRAAIFIETKKIYNIRSKIVHGSGMDAQNDKIRDMGDTALSYLKRCLGTLIEDRPDLIGLASTERVRRLILEDKIG